MQKIAVVTGGSTGIGHHLVGALAQAGYRVAFNYRSTPTPAQELASNHKKQGFEVKAYQCDVGDEADVTEFYASVAKDFGRSPDLLVNNAGIQTWSPLLDLKVSDWDNVIRTNLRGCFLNTQMAARLPSRIHI